LNLIRRHVRVAALQSFPQPLDSGGQLVQFLRLLRHSHLKCAQVLNIRSSHSFAMRSTRSGESKPLRIGSSSTTSAR